MYTPEMMTPCGQSRAFEHVLDVSEYLIYRPKMDFSAIHCGNAVCKSDLSKQGTLSCQAAKALFQTLWTWKVQAQPLPRYPAVGINPRPHALTLLLRSMAHSVAVSPPNERPGIDTATAQPTTPHPGTQTNPHVPHPAPEVHGAQGGQCAPQRVARHPHVERLPHGGVPRDGAAGGAVHLVDDAEDGRDQLQGGREKRGSHRKTLFCAKHPHGTWQNAAPGVPCVCG